MARKRTEDEVIRTSTLKRGVSGALAVAALVAVPAAQAHFALSGPSGPAAPTRCAVGHRNHVRTNGAVMFVGGSQTTKQTTVKAGGCR
jgi:hypothetical protein